VFRTIFFCIAVILSIPAYSQNGFIVVKKRNRPVLTFGKDSRLTFLQDNGQWITGMIDKIVKDSFYFTEEIIRYYTIGTDTLHLKGLRFALTDIYAIPSKRQQYYFYNDQVHITLGHENFVWIRNGFIFQVAGAGYAGLNIINDLGRKEPPFAKNNITSLSISAATFLLGTMLHIKFDPYIRPGKKYTFHLIQF
jgi:hypothetical protein